MEHSVVKIRQMPQLYLLDNSTQEVTIDELVIKEEEEVATVEESDATHAILDIVPSSLRHIISGGAGNDSQDNSTQEVTIDELVENIKEEVGTMGESDGAHTILHVVPSSAGEVISGSANNESQLSSSDTQGARSIKFYCFNCGNCYSNSGSLKLHMRACLRKRQEVPPEDRKCHICSKVFNSVAYLKQHMLRHTGEGPRRCTRCDRKFTDDEKYTAHFETHKQQDKLEAEAAALTEANGDTHGVSFKAEFHCSNCGNGYGAAGSLKQHMLACMRQRSKVPLEDCICHICNKVFNSVAYWKEHMLGHTGEGPRSCVRCYCKFTDDETYNAHVETHKQQDKLEAEASSALNEAYGAKKVVVKEFTCSFCNENFTAVFDVEKVKIRYACDTCREKYSNAEQLKKHKQMVDDKREFHCERCGRKFVFEGFLQRHIPTCDGTIKRRRDMK